tara:strand:+ start:687 stop:1190 length:504 start_codon:yes stop_codon:yes gene_type:complete
MPLSFRGVAHPPPSKKRGNIADLSGEEIRQLERSEKLNMGAGNGTDVLVEHDHASRVGSVTASWQGRNGELRVAGTIDDGQAEQLVRAGKLRGLSLGTGVTQRADNGEALMRTQDELSICEAPRRGGCFIDTIDGASVRTVACFSETSNRKSSPLTLPPIRPAIGSQ